MRLLRFNVRMAQVVDFSNLCLLAHVAAKVKEKEDQEKENHAAVVGDERHREISIKQQEEEHHHDDYGDESRMIMTAKKRKREHVDMPFNCNKLIKIRSPTSSSCGRGRDHHHHHGPSESKSPIWICNKLLMDSDTGPHQNRLLLAAATIKYTLLPYLS